MSKKKNLYILSDSTGDTASRVVKAALKQFVGDQVTIRRFPHVLRKSEVRGILAEAAKTQTLVAHTFAAKPLREITVVEAAAVGIETLDLFGPLLDALEDFLAAKPKEEPGLLHKIDEAYFQRIDAVEFAVMHDDGKHLEGLKHADFVLVGVSRSGKTPLSVYLALEGWRVGNVPFVQGQPIPKAVLDLPKEKLVGLTIDPRRLADIRRARMDYLSPGATTDYDDARAVRDEVNWSRRIFQKHKITMVDVTQRAIEETAHLVLKAVRKEGLSRSKSKPAGKKTSGKRTNRHKA